jgi:hypothetical protein
MCTTTFGTLTLAGMLNDPLILAMMRSDGVSEGEHAALLFRVKDTLAVREPFVRGAGVEPALERADV